MKIVLIGDSSVGKSALVYRFVHNKQITESKATVGIAFFKQNLIDPDTREEYGMQIWDTAGQEKFQSVTTHHYRAADGALVVFDISSEQSFISVDKWLAELRDNTDPNVAVALVGTKGDLSHKRAVPSERARAYAQEHGLLYMETSALWDKCQGSPQDFSTGVESVFTKLLRDATRRRREEGDGRTPPTRLDISGYGSGKDRSQVDLEKRWGRTRAGCC